MRMVSAVLIAVLVAVFIGERGMAASDPAQALADGRNAIEGKEYQRAVDILHAGIASALVIVDQKKQDEALVALHFYRALAYASIPNDAGARAELREFFRLRPGKSTVDPRKYPAHFVDLF